MSQFYKKYIIGKKLGSGAYGSVYLITDKQNKKYVIKLIDKKALEKKRADKSLEEIRKYIKKSLYREYTILKEIKDIPHVVKYYEHYDNLKFKGHSYFGIVMEYIEGYELSKLYICAEDINYMIPKNIILKFMLEMFKTLNLLHERNIVHRDIKLENIMFNEKELTLVDFGFSCITKTDNTRLQCPTDRMFGTALYMSPELLRWKFTKNNYAFKSSDIWAMGITLYILTNLKFPFYATKLKELQKKIKKGIYIPSNYPDKEINKIVDACLTYNYKERPTAKQLYDIIIEDYK